MRAIAFYLALLLGSLVACSRREVGPSGTRQQRESRGRATFVLMRLDGRRLPTAYADPRGRYTLRAARLTLDPSGDLWLETDLVPEPDTVEGRISRLMLVSTYQRAGADSLVFPAEGGATPEFFGKMDGAGGLRVVAHPLPRADGSASATSVAREQGGAHVWEFQVP